MNLKMKDTSSVGEVRFIAIDGHGGSGKSTLAKLLAQQYDAEIIRIDDFASWDNSENWWPLVIEQIFKPIETGATVLNYSRSKWWESHHPEPVVNQPVTNIMILEGVGALRREFRQYLALGIFVDTPLDVCMQRGLERDKRQDGKSDDEIKHMWQQWYKNEEVYMKSDKPQAFADVIFDGTKSFQEQYVSKGYKINPS